MFYFIFILCYCARARRKNTSVANSSVILHGKEEFAMLHMSFAVLFEVLYTACVYLFHFPQWKFGLLSLGKSVVTVVLPNHVIALYWHYKIIEHIEMQHKI